LVTGLFETQLVAELDGVAFGDEDLLVIVGVLVLKKFGDGGAGARSLVVGVGQQVGVVDDQVSVRQRGAPSNDDLSTPRP